MDVFGKIVAAILVVFMIYINPLQYLFESHASVTTSYVEAKSKEFVDHVCQTGSIQVHDYEQLSSDLNDTGDYYGIELEHTHPVTGVELSASEDTDTKLRLATQVENSSLIRTSTTHTHTDACYIGPYGAHFHNEACYTINPGVYCGAWSFSYSTTYYNYTGSVSCGNCGSSSVSYSGDPTRPSVTGYCNNCGARPTIVASSSYVYKNYTCSGCSSTNSWASNSGTSEPTSHYVGFSKTLTCTIPQGQYSYGNAAYGVTVCNKQMRSAGFGSYKYFGYAYFEGYTYPSPRQGMYPGYDWKAMFYYHKYSCDTCKKYTYIFAPEFTGLDGLEVQTYPQYFRVIETSDSTLNITLNESAYKRQGYVQERVGLTTYVDLALFMNEFDRAASAAGYISRVISGTGYASEAVWHYGDIQGGYDSWVFRLKNYGDGWVSSATNCSHLSFQRGRLVCDQIVVNLTPVTNPQTVRQWDAIDQRAVVTYLNGSTSTVACSTSFNTGTIGNGQVATLYYAGYANAAAVGNNVSTTFSCVSIVNVTARKRFSSIQANMSATTINRGDSFPITSVTLIYDNGETETVYSGWWITGFNNAIGGHQNVTVYYEKDGITASKVVTIYVRQLAGITANMYASAISKYSAFPITNLTLTYNDGSTETVTQGWHIAGFVNNARGTYTVTISYTVSGITCYTWVSITVVNLSTLCNVCGNWYFLDDNDYDNGCPYCLGNIDHIYLSVYELELTYGASLDLDVYAVYKDGHTQLVTGWTSTYEPYNIGDQIVTVTYGGHRDKLIVRMKANKQCNVCGFMYSLNKDGSDPGCPICKNKITSISAAPSYSVVPVGGNLELTVEATYVDGHKAVITGWTSNFLNYRIGIQTVTITYQGQSTHVTVEVIKNENLVTCEKCGNRYDVNVNPKGCPYCSKIIDYIQAYLITDGTKVQLGSDLKLKIVITYKDSHRSFAYSGYTVGNYNKNKLGRQTVRVEYAGYHCTLDIEVVNTIQKVTCPNGHVYSLNEDGSDPGCPYCSDTNTTRGISYLYVIYTTDILEVLYTTGVYEIPKGDYFTIVVTKKQTSSQLKTSFFMHSNFLGANKKFTYGGEVA